MAYVSSIPQWHTPIVPAAHDVYKMYTYIRCIRSCVPIPRTDNPVVARGELNQTAPPFLSTRSMRKCKSPRSHFGTYQPASLSATHARVPVW